MVMPVTVECLTRERSVRVGVVRVVGSWIPGSNPFRVLGGLTVEEVVVRVRKAVGLTEAIAWKVEGVDWKVEAIAWKKAIARKRGSLEEMAIAKLVDLSVALDT